MKWSNSFIQTQKETPKEAEAISHQLMIRGGLIRLLASGIYSYLPLGLRVLQNVEAIIRQGMNQEGAVELLLPALQPADLWQMSGRFKTLGKDMISFKDRHGKLNVLGPTHEEVITTLVKGEVKSYRQLPLILYQIQTKFRDEARPRFGVIRSREFIMKDAYSFDVDEASLSESYNKMLSAYKKIFSRCGLTTWMVEADPGVMGGNRSHEFIVPAESGESVVGYCEHCQTPWSISDEGTTPTAEEKLCPKCKKEGRAQRGLEVGHIFQLGTKYSSALDATYLDDKGNRRPILMGCYGIGVTRILAAVIEQHHDKDGIIWPDAVAPFQVLVLPLLSEAPCLEMAKAIYQEGEASGWEILLDERSERAGSKFKDADLIGIPYQVVIGKTALAQGKVEIKRRRDGKRWAVSRPELFRKLEALASGNPENPSQEPPQAEPDSLVERLRDTVQRILDERNVELVDLVFRREGPKQVLRILVDTPEGIRLDECSELNQIIGQVLDEKNLIQERYLLEVASPGLDRPLKSARDFKRVIGKTVRLYLKKPLAGENILEGMLEELREEKLVLRLKTLEAVELSLHDLSKGERVVQF